MFSLQQAERSISARLQEVSSESFQILRVAVKNVDDSDDPNEEDSLIATISAWSIVHGLSVLLLENKLSKNPEIKKIKREKIIDQATAIFTQGLINLQK
jgi:hypothetical protein